MAEEFETISGMIKPFMHVLLMIWKHSKFYNTPPVACVARAHALQCDHAEGE